MPALRRLDITGTQVRNLSGLCHPAIEILRLGGTAIDDLAACAKLERLRVLDVGRSAIRTIPEMPALQELSVAFTRVDMLPSLRMLDASHTALSDISPLASSPKLQHLQLQSCPVRDLTPLAGLRFLRALDLAAIRGDPRVLLALPPLGRLVIT